MKRVLVVVELETGKEVRAIDVTGQSDRNIELVERGLLRNMNLDKFGVKGPEDRES